MLEYLPIIMPIDREIETMFAASESDDVDKVLAAFERLNSIATVADLPILVAAIQSPRNNFWTRELLSQPICDLGGPDCLEPLLEALQLGFDEGHDNDGFQASLWSITDSDPAGSRAKLEELLARSDFKYREPALRLLEFCKTA